MSKNNKNKKGNKNTINKNTINKKKYFRKTRYYKGGSSFEQKGVAAQLRPSAPHNGALRKKLNEIVHSGDFYESKERNGFLNLNNDFDPEAQAVLNEAVAYIKENKDLSTKIKKRVLQGIAPVSTLSSSRTPTKTNKTIKTNTMTTSTKLNHSRNQRRTRRRL